MTVPTCLFDIIFFDKTFVEINIKVANNFMLFTESNVVFYRNAIRIGIKHFSNKSIIISQQ